MANNKKTNHSASDIEEHKMAAAIGYIGILCFIPLLLKKESDFAQFHGKQGLAIFIAEVIAAMLSFTVIVPVILWPLAILASVYGIYLVFNGQKKEIPGAAHIVKILNI